MNHNKKIANHASKLEKDRFLAMAATKLSLNIDAPLTQALINLEKLQLDGQSKETRNLVTDQLNKMKRTVYRMQELHDTDSLSYEKYSDSTDIINLK